MSVTSRLLGVRAAAPADRAHNRAPKGGASNVWWSSPGQPQTPEWDGLTAIRNGYQASIYVMQPVRIIATALGSLPFRVGVNPDKRNDYDQDASMARLLGPPPHGPNPVTSPRNLWIWSLVQRLLTGRMAWETLCPPGVDAPAALWPLVTPFLQPIPSQPGTPSWFDGFIYQLPSGRIDYKSREVFYSWRPSQIDWRQPESALQAASMPASLQIALDRYMWALAKNGLAAKKLVITPDFAEDDERRAWEDQFASEFTGYDNGGRVLHGYYEDDPQAAPTAGNRTPPIQVVDLASSPTDAQVLEILTAVKNDMLRTWRVPMSWMGDSSARTYENASQEAKNFWQGPVMELAAEVCDDANLTLAPRFGDGKVGWFDFSGVEALKGTSIFGPIDPAAAKKAGLIVNEDWRTDVGLPPLAGDPPQLEAEALPAIDDSPGGASKANFTRATSTLVAAGLCVKALDTGRVLLLQRSLSDDDPASGTWEFPGGKLEPDEDPFAAAVREWQEETGCVLPQGSVAGTWISPNGVYRGFIYLVKTESLITCNLDHEDRHVLNPDDPDGDQIEVVAWWNPAQLPAMTGLRPEARKGTDWHLIATAGNDRTAGNGFDPSVGAAAIAQLEGALAGLRATRGYDPAPLALGDFDRWAEINEPWLERAAATAVAAGGTRFDPAQPRGPHGKWSKVGAAAHKLAKAAGGDGGPKGLSDGDVAAFRGGSAEKHLVTDATGTHFTAERQALHEKIIDGMLTGHASQQHPEYHLMGGGSASGKSTMIDHVAGDIHDAALINADDVKEQLPEYHGHGASFTHEESSFIAKAALTEAFRRRLNLTLDGTGDSSVQSLRKKIDAARAAGYSVHGHYVTVPTDIAVARAERRAARTGRHVPRTVVEHIHRSVSQTLPQAMDAFDTLDVYDNTGQLTKILTKARGGTAQVFNAKLWQAFLDKAKEPSGV